MSETIVLTEGELVAATRVRRWTVQSRALMDANMFDKYRLRCELLADSFGADPLLLLLQ